MSFDCSRFTFNAWYDFLGVVMQQGRVQLDADWNEFVSQLMRRMQAGTLDTFEQAVVPRTTPDGFRIEAVGGALKIGVGRIYVDGLQAENHGTGVPKWDAVLAEQVGSVALDYTKQPYYPDPPQLPAAGNPFLIYVDVWQREVTHLQYPNLVEKAVGIDTTGRMQTVWQVKVLPDIGTGTFCDSPWDEIPDWIEATLPSGARLSTSTGSMPDMPDPCQIPPSGGYKGLENQLYRVEIHDGGTVGTATFKWSRDNATVASRVSHINATGDRIVVESLGRDEVLRFSDGDWVEITDNVRELHGEPGLMRRIQVGGGVDDAAHAILLTEPLTAGLFPTNALEETDPLRNTRVRRWDQGGAVLREDGDQVADLDDPDATGVIEVPPAGIKLFLEHGILVDFVLVPDSGGFRTGDYWYFAARTIDASIEILEQAPPRGIHHHYARLAIVTFPDTESDCRVLWPPEFEPGNDCTCDRCITPEGHNNGTATLQQAVDALAITGGVICLGVGIYRLREPLRVANAGSLRIRGKGWRTLLVTESPGPVMRISDSLGVTIENLAATGAALGNLPTGVIEARNTLALELDKVYLTGLSPEGAFSTGILLGGYALGTRVHECAVVADVGVAGGEVENDMLLANALVITDSLFLCSMMGISLARSSLHSGETRIARNLILNARQIGVQAVGAALPGSSFLIEGNILQPIGDNIRAGIDGLRILNNEMSSTGQTESNGIVLETGLDPAGIGHCWIIGNRMADLQGAGIAVRTALGSAIIKQNVIERTWRGIASTGAATAKHLSIENNHLIDIAADFNPPNESLIAIQVLAAKRADIVDNVVNGFAVNALQAPDRVAIRVVGCTDIRIDGNHLSDLGAPFGYRGYVAAIELVAPFTLANIVDNIITRVEEGDIAASNWQAIRVAPSSTSGPGLLDGVMLAAGETSFLLTGDRLRALVQKSANGISMRGNQIIARRSETPLVEVRGTLNILFADNQCEAEPVAGVEFPRAIVEIREGAAIVSQNRVRWTSGDFDAVSIFGSHAFTVIGNITMGNIRVNNAPLDDPWKPLNILAP